MSESPEGQGMKSFMDMAAARARARREPVPDQSGLSENTQLFRVPAEDADTVEESPFDLKETFQEPAVQSLARKEDHLSRALRPVVESTIERALDRKSPEIAESLYPYIGKAVRRSVVESLKGIVDSVNATVEQTFTIQGLKWRFEAMRTGRSVSDIVMRQSVVYRVEEVFLTHLETGLLLEYVSLDPKRSENRDLVSGMLSAIDSFISDSFQAAQSEHVSSFSMGDLTIYVEHGPRALLAVAVRGNIPRGPQQEFGKKLEQIHHQFSGALVHFDGNTEPLAGSKYLLNELLELKQMNAPKKKSPKYFYFIFAILLATLAAFTVLEFKRHRDWKSFAQTLENEPGIQLINMDREWRHYHLDVLADPDSRLPELVKNCPDKSHTINAIPIPQTDDAMLLRRALKMLPPAPEGTAVNLTAKNGILSATGEASNLWIREATPIAETLQGLRKFDLSSLSNLDLQECRVTAAKIEASRTRFIPNEAKEVPEDQNHLDQLSGLLRLLDQQALQANLDYQVNIYAIGTDQRSNSDQILATDRTTYVRRELITRNVDPGRIIAKDILPNSLKNRAQDFDSTILVVDFKQP